MANSTVHVFLSHNAADKDFARRLAHDLASYGVDVWLDEDKIRIGESIIEKVSEGIDSADYVVVVLSPESVRSRWVSEELDMAMTHQIGGGKTRVLPLLYKPCEIPRILMGKLYADFTRVESYSSAFETLLRTLGIDPTLRKLDSSRSDILGGLMVRVVDGKPIRWKVPAVLTWSVDHRSFEGFESEAQIAQVICSRATADWNEAAKRQQIEHRICFENDISHPVFRFAYYNKDLAGFLSTSFFPDDSVDRRIVYLFPALFSPECKIDPVSAIRHDLGHILGFRHEHIHPEAPPEVKSMYGWEEPDNAVPLGAYNPNSVMHYGSADLQITRSDEAGLRMLYTLPPSLTFEFPV